MPKLKHTCSIEWADLYKSSKKIILNPQKTQILLKSKIFKSFETPRVTTCSGQLTDLKIQSHVLIHFLIIISYFYTIYVRTSLSLLPPRIIAASSPGQKSFLCDWRRRRHILGVCVYVPTRVSSVHNYKSYRYEYIMKNVLKNKM